MIDTLHAVVDLLAGNTAVAALVVKRVYGAELPEFTPHEGTLMPRKCIVAKYAGSGRLGENDYLPIHEPRIDLLCYGETPYEADRVRRSTYKVMKELKRKVQGDVVLFRATHSGGPVQLRDGDTGWPLIVESWLILAADAAPMYY